MFRHVSTNDLLVAGTTDPQPSTSKTTAEVMEEGNHTDSSLETQELVETELKLRQRLEQQQGTKSRNKQANSEEWERNLSKKLRREGKPYIGRIKNKDGTVSVVIRPAKTMGPPCNSIVCKGANCKRRCSQFSYEERKGIHKKFWRELNWEQRKMYVYAHVSIVAKKEDSKKDKAQSKKQKTFTYHLTNSDNEKLIVCKQMFINTLCLGEKQIVNWTKSGSFGIPNATVARKKRVREKTEFPGYTDVKAFLENLPKHPSRGKEGGYIIENFYQKNELYKSYVKHCEERGKTPTSNTTMRRVMEDMKWHLPKPKKDQLPPRVPTNTGQPRKKAPRAPTTSRVPNVQSVASSNIPTEACLLNTSTAQPLPGSSSHPVQLHPQTFTQPNQQSHQYNPLNPYNPYFAYENRQQDQNNQPQGQQHHVVMHNRGFYPN
jgi:hypothetical protein